MGRRARQEAAVADEQGQEVRNMPEKALERITLIDLEKGYENMKAVEWYWKPYLPANEMVCFIYGPEGIGKTTMALHMIKPFTDGAKFPGANHGVDDWPRHIFYVNADAKHESLNKKLIDFQISKQYIISPLYTHPGTEFYRDVTIADMENIKLQLLKMHSEGTPPALIVLDGWQSFHRHPENRSDIMTRAMSKVRELVTYGQCPLVIIHHANKPNQFTNELNPLFRLRGSTAQGANAELAIMIDWNEKDKHKVSMQVTKSNISEIPTKELVFTITRKGLKYEGFIAEPVPEPTKKEQLADWLREALAEGPIPSKQLREDSMAMFGVSQSLIYEVKDDLNLGQKTVDGKACWVLPEISAVPVVTQSMEQVE